MFSISSNLGLHKVLWDRMVLPHGGRRLVLRLGGQPGERAPVPVNVLELVHFAAADFGRLSLRVAGPSQRVQSHAGCRHGVRVQLIVSDEVGVRVEVELLFFVVKDRRHGTLPDAIHALLLRATNLLPDPFSVIMLDLLKPTEKQNITMVKMRVRCWLTYV